MFSWQFFDLGDDLPEDLPQQFCEVSVINTSSTSSTTTIVAVLFSRLIHLVVLIWM